MGWGTLGFGLVCLSVPYKDIDIILTYPVVIKHVVSTFYETHMVHRGLIRSGEGVNPSCIITVNPWLLVAFSALPSLCLFTMLGIPARVVVFCSRKNISPGPQRHTSHRKLHSE